MPPVLVIVSEIDGLLPKVTLPKLRLAGLGSRSPGTIPVPDNAILSVGLEAFDVIVTVPLALPADVGLKETLKVALCPAVSVRGVLIPLRLYPVPLIPTWEIVTLVPPVLVSVSDKAWLLPTVTLPKLRLVGFDATVPGATPVPDSGSDSVESEAVEVMVTAPLALPLASGAKATVKVVLCEAFRVNGVVTPLSWNPAPLTDAWEISTLAPPLLVSVTVCACLAPTITLPKSSLRELSTSWPAVDAVPVPESARAVGLLAASLVMVSVPLKAPDALGKNLTLIEVFCPAAIVTGRLVAARE